MLKFIFKYLTGEWFNFYMDGPPSGPSESSQRTLGYSKEYEPIVKEAVNRAVYEASKPYEAYQGPRIAGFDALQEKAFRDVSNMKPAEQIGTATQMAGLAGLRAGEVKYDPTSITAERASTSQFIDPNVIQQYMSPYMQYVVDIQKREAQRQADIANVERSAKAVGSGAFGGTRQAILDAEANRNFMQQMGDIQARGSQTAYEQAAQQFQTDQARRLQAALANQQAMLEAQRLTEQSRQYGAGLNLQGIQTQLSSAGQLERLAQTQFAQQRDIANARAMAGAQRQALEQARLTQDYEDFMEKKQHPYKQIAFMTEMTKAAPQQTTESIYRARPSLFSQAAGAGVTAYGLSRAGGGSVSEHEYEERPAGLGELALRNAQMKARR